MEREEAGLLKKLQEAQFRQQAAFAVLEDVMQQPASSSSPASAAGGLSGTNVD